MGVKAQQVIDELWLQTNGDAPVTTDVASIRCGPLNFIETIVAMDGLVRVGQEPWDMVCLRPLGLNWGAQMILYFN